MTRLLLIVSLLASLSPPALMVYAVTRDERGPTASDTGGIESEPLVDTDTETSADDSDTYEDDLLEERKRRASRAKLNRLTRRAGRFIRTFDKAPLTEGVPSYGLARRADDLHASFEQWLEDRGSSAYPSDRKVARAVARVLKKAEDLANNPTRGNLAAYNNSIRRLGR